MFNIYLRSENSLHQDVEFPEGKKYGYEIDDETSVIFDICDVFEESGIKFLVSVFGQDEWPVSCRFDLPGIIEELPIIINKIRQEEYNFNLNFYEQGIEREVIFKESESGIVLTCLSRTNWSPVPSTLEMDKRDVKRILINLYENFIFCSTVLCPSLINNPLLTNWLGLSGSQ